jgi:ABC-type lipoprotein export system ATPase subunit
MFDGKAVTGLPERELNHFRNREIGFVFQMHHLMPQCTLLENVLLPTLPVRDKRYRREAEGRAEALIRAVDLWDQRHQFPWSLSGGECQRAAVVRALINQPRLLLADEPTGSLDHENAQAVAGLLLKLNAELNCALLVVTHSTELAGKMETGYVLKDGVLKKSS